MKLRSRLVTAFISLGLAAGAGYFAQNGTSLGLFSKDETPEIELAQAGAVQAPLTRSLVPSSSETDPEVDRIALEIVPGAAVTFLPAAPEAPTAFHRPVSAPARLATLEAGYQDTINRTDTALSGFGVPCGIELSAQADAAAMVQLELQAGCHPHTRVTITHEGLRFSAYTSNIGHLTVDVPALAEDARFAVLFPDGEGATTVADVPALADYERLVLQWRGETGLQIHARENGADYGSSGHIWTGNPGSPDRAAQGLGGFVTALGNTAIADALLAEVYTFPRVATEEGVVRLSVEAEILDSTCEREVQGQSMRLSPESDLQITDLSLVMPDCGSVGDFLVLKNILQDLKIAQN